MADKEPSDGKSFEEARKDDLKNVLESFQTSAGARKFADQFDSAASESGSSGVGEVSDEDNDSEAVEALEHLKKQHKAEIDRLEADNKQRQWFFVFVLVITAVPVCIASAAMMVYVCRGGDSEAVYVGYFASVVVEVIGLSVVIANYLFPRNGSIQIEEEKDQ